MACYRRFHDHTLTFGVVILFVGLLVVCSSRAIGQSFDQNYQASWGYDHFTRFDNNQRVQLTMDKASGSGFRSKQDFYTGMFEMRIKLPAFSNGVVTSYYLISDSGRGVHEELDLEFLGDRILQTNIFINGIGNREQRIHLWFDTTAKFHTYAILRNPYIIVFYIDGIPIRVFKNGNSDELPFLRQPLRIHATIWDGSNWAGGPIDWSKGPFKAQYEGFGINGCPSSNGPQTCASPALPWNKNHGLSPKQQREYQKFKSNYMFYDYCNDNTRKPAYPRECHSI
ncbi:hypothetical protein Dimus_016620 [Dionaea muscipula]